MKLVVDVENTVTTRDGKLHLDPYEPNNTLTMVGIGDANGSGEPIVFTFDHAEMQADDANKLKALLKDASLLIMHNAQHDLQWLWGCGFEFDCDIYDTMLAEYVLCRGVKKGLSLEKCAERYELPHSKSDTLKEYGIGAQILSLLGVKRIKLLSNSKLPKVVGLEGYGLQIDSTEGF